MMKLIFVVLYVSLNDGPYTLLLDGSFYICVFSSSTSIRSHDTDNSDFENKWPPCGLVLPVSILALLSSSVCDSASAYKFYPN